MPFTISHAVAVLPLARGRRLVPAALVVGSWVPDLPYFVPLLGGSDATHAAYGPVTVDLLLGLPVLALWQLVLRRPLVDLAPAWLRARVPPPRRLDRAYALGAVVSVALGATTHVVWDTFTHRDRWGTRHVALLDASLGPLPAYKWFQLVSGALGLLGLVVWAVLRLRRTSPRRVPSRVGPAGRGAAWAGVVGVGLLVAAVAAREQLTQGRSLEATAFAVATRSMGAAAAVVVLIGVLWHLRVGATPEDGEVAAGQSRWGAPRSRR